MASRYFLVTNHENLHFKAEGLLVKEDDQKIILRIDNKESEMDLPFNKADVKELCSRCGDYLNTNGAICSECRESIYYEI
jgi:hypothetical protein